MVVTLAGAEVKPEFFGIPYLVNPGSITVEASAPKHEPRRETVAPSPGQSVEVKIALTPVVVAAPAPAPAAMTAPTTALAETAKTDEVAWA